MIDKTSWEFGFATHAGPKEINEDRCFIKIGKGQDGSEFAVALVADGMGGYQAGDYASEFVISVIQGWWETRIPFLTNAKEPLPRISSELESVLNDINDGLLEIKQLHGTSLGTTLSLIFLYHGKYIIKHVGDSRIYKLTKEVKEERPFQGSLEETAPLDLQLLEAQSLNNHLVSSFTQITEDHSWVELQVKKGLITKEQARTHNRRNIILQCLGMEKQLNIFETYGEYGGNNLFMLCSDGFYALFSNEEIAAMIVELQRQLGDLQLVCDRLMEIALQTGQATDNITIVLIRHVPTHVKRKWKERFFSAFK